MNKSVYDTNDDGIVDNAEKVNGHTVNKDVPASAKFTDTTYSVATTTKNGLMSKEDKVKLDGIEASIVEVEENLTKKMKKQNILWSDVGAYMSKNQVAQLSENLSNQNKGIVLVFTEWDIDKDERKGWGYNTFFIPKTIPSITWEGVGMSFQMFWQNTPRAYKYLYIYDDKIMGADDNVATQNGVNNKNQVLVAVIGV